MNCWSECFLHVSDLPLHISRGRRGWPSFELVHVWAGTLKFPYTEPAIEPCLGLECIYVVECTFIEELTASLYTHPNTHWYELFTYMIKKYSCDLCVCFFGGGGGDYAHCLRLFTFICNLQALENPCLWALPWFCKYSWVRLRMKAVCGILSYPFHKFYVTWQI